MGICFDIRAAIVVVHGMGSLGSAVALGALYPEFAQLSPTME